MPVNFVPPPPDVQKLTQGKLQDMAQQKHFRIAPLATAQPGEIKLESPHSVYNIGLDDILNNKPLSSIPINAWRFVVRTASKDPAAAEASTTPQGTSEFSSVNSGPFVAGTIAALAALSSDPTFAKGAWEGRLIRVPALYVMAIWAHNTTSGQDLIRPIAPTPGFLDPSKAYTWDEFRAALEAPAKQNLATDNSPG
jgi:hypothetical protein